MMQREFSERTAEEWVEKIRGALYPRGPVNTLAEALADEHLASTDMLQEIEHPLAGVLQMLLARRRGRRTAADTALLRRP